MKVLMITDSFMKGGKERRLLELLLFFEKKEGMQFLLVLLRDQIEYPVIKSLKNTRLIVFHRKIKKDPAIFFKLWNLCREEKPDIVHSWGSQPSVYFSPVCFFQGIPLINGMITNAHFKKFTGRWLRAKFTFPFSSIVVSNSQAGLDAYGAPPKKSRVIYNGVHLDRFSNLPSPENLRKELKITKPYVVGMVGAFHPRKDYATYIKAIKQIAGERNDICFLAIGDGKMLDHYKSEAKDIPSDTIKFLGNQEHVEKYIDLFDVGILLTNAVVHQEGLSNAIIEYMALGKPVIATRGGGTNELVENNVDGYLINPHDPQMFIEKLYHLIDNEKVRLEFGKKGRAKIEQNFAISVMSTQFLNLYKELCRKK